MFGFPFSRLLLQIFFNLIFFLILETRRKTKKSLFCTHQKNYLDSAFNAFFFFLRETKFKWLFTHLILFFYIKPVQITIYFFFNFSRMTNGKRSPRKKWNQRKTTFNFVTIWYNFTRSQKFSPVNELW